MLHRGVLPQSKLEIKSIRELSRDDLACLHEKRTTPVVQRLRDPHHALARLVASGVRLPEAASRCGFSLSRARVLHADPTFQDLVSSYRKDVDAAWRQAQDDYQSLAVANMVKAERQIAEKLEAADETGEFLPTRDLLAISRDAADRFGYGKKNTNVNVNIDFAAKLEAARARSNTVKSSAPQVIEGTLVRRT